MFLENDLAFLSVAHARLFSLKNAGCCVSARAGELGRRAAERWHLFVVVVSLAKEYAAR